MSGVWIPYGICSTLCRLWPGNPPQCMIVAWLTISQYECMQAALNFVSMRGVGLAWAE